MGRKKKGGKSPKNLPGKIGPKAQGKHGPRQTQQKPPKAYHLRGR